MHNEKEFRLVVPNILGTDNSSPKTDPVKTEPVKPKNNYMDSEDDDYTNIEDEGDDEDEEDDEDDSELEEDDEDEDEEEEDEEGNF